MAVDGGLVLGEGGRKQQWGGGNQRNQPSDQFWRLSKSAWEPSVKKLLSGSPASRGHSGDTNGSHRLMPWGSWTPDILLDQLVANVWGSKTWSSVGGAAVLRSSHGGSLGRVRGARVAPMVNIHKVKGRVFVEMFNYPNSMIIVDQQPSHKCMR